jgi:FkbM family methyltransferase
VADWIERQNILLKEILEERSADGWHHRWLETATEAFYSAILQPGDHAIDVGANRARHSVPMAKAVGADGRILAIEAASATAAKLARDLNVAGVADRVEIGRFAVSDTPGTAEFTYVPSATGLSSLRTDEKFDAYADRVTETVEVRTLDDVVAPGRRIAFIKLDIEGAELPALRGARRLLRESRPPLAFEHGGLRYERRFGYTFDEFYGFFEDIDYQLLTPFGSPFGPEWKGKNHAPQLFALPREGSAAYRERFVPAMVEAMYRMIP